MSANRYEVLVRPDDRQSVKRQIEARSLKMQQAIYDWAFETNDHGWSEDEALETLDGRFQTYAFMVGGETRYRLAFTREIGTNTYYVLGVVDTQSGASLEDLVYTEACKAHGLSHPKRVP